MSGASDRPPKRPPGSTGTSRAQVLLVVQGLRQHCPMIRGARAHRLQLAAIAMVAAFGCVTALVMLGATSRSASAVELPPVAKKMRAFGAPPLQESALPSNVRVALDRLPDLEIHGSARLNQVRLLRQHLGTHRVGLYALPTSEGAVCFIVNEQTYYGTCTAEFSLGQGNLLTALYLAEEVPFTIAGLASDDVTSVSAVVDGQTRTVSLKKNVFFWQSDSIDVTRENLDELRVEQSDGSSITVDTP